jgi:hypothetical protein
MAQSAAVELRPAGENGDDADVFEARGSTPQEGRKRAARRSGRACRRRLGWRGTARAGGVHGGGLGHALGKKSRGGEEHAGEGGERRAAAGELIPSSRGSAAFIQTGGSGAVASGGNGAARQLLPAGGGRRGGRGGLGRKLGCYLLHRAADKTEGEAGWPEIAQEKKRKEKKLFLFSVF